MKANDCGNSVAERFDTFTAIIQNSARCKATVIIIKWLSVIVLGYLRGMYCITVVTKRQLNRLLKEH